MGLHPSSLLAIDEAQVEKTFQEFQKDWIKKLNTGGMYGEKNVRVEKSARDDAEFIATYDVVKEPKASHIKKTNEKATPYIGTIQYEVWTCKSIGKTPEEAKGGPFTCEPHGETKEIFRFTGDKWVY